MVLAYVICKDKKEAEKIALHLLRKRLIACANMFPIRSMYLWDGKIANENEYFLILKTNEKNFRKAAAEIKRIHSYQIPCILKVNAKANKEYENWADMEMN